MGALVQIYVGCVIVSSFVFLLFNLAEPDMVFLATLAFLLAGKVITVTEGLEGFSNTGLLTVAILFPVAQGISETGALDYAMSRLLGRPKSIIGAQLRLMIPIAIVSAFLNNTPVVLIMIPIVQTWARNCKLPVSQLFIPLSFASILGGTVTLIGTSTNLVVAGLSKERYSDNSGECISPNGDIIFRNVRCSEDPGGCSLPIDTACVDPNFFQPFGVDDIQMFDLSIFGVPVAIAGMLYIIIFSPFLLPGGSRPPQGDEAEGKNTDNSSPTQARHSISNIFDDFVVGARVLTDSPVHNQSVKDAGLRELDSLYLISIIRGSQIYHSEVVGPEFVIFSGDILEFAGVLEDLETICRKYMLQPISHDGHLSLPNAFQGARNPIPGHIRTNYSASPRLGTALPSGENRSPKVAVSENMKLIKASIPPDSTLIGKDAAEISFRSKYGGVILGILRNGSRVEGSLGQVTFHQGDILLISMMDPSRQLQWANDIDAVIIGESRPNPSESFSIVREFMVAMTLQWHSPLVGQSVIQAGLRGLPGLYLASLEREGGEVLTVVCPETVLEANDVLFFVGDIQSVTSLRKIPGLVPHDDQVDKLEDQAHVRRLVEVVLAPRSELIHKTVRETKFRSQYNAAIIGVHRNGQRLVSRIGDIKLEAGDVLLLDAGPSFVQMYKDNRIFALVAELDNSTPPQFQKVWIAGAAAGAMIILASADLVNLVIGGLFASMIMIVSGVISVPQARKSVAWDVIVTIACAFGISKGLENSGLADNIASGLVDLAKFSATGETGILVALYIATVLLSTIMANNAAAALMFPVAAATAEEQQMKIERVIFLLMLAASASFASPFGYQTNLMVFGPGGYTFKDFLRFGGPMLLWQSVISVASVMYDESWPKIWSIMVGAIVIFILLRQFIENFQLEKTGNFLSAEKRRAPVGAKDMTSPPPTPPNYKSRCFSV